MGGNNPPISIQPPPRPGEVIEIYDLPDWVPPTQDSNPTGQDINTVSNTVSQRVLTISPWGSYVPVVFGTDIVGPILTLVQKTNGFVYLRLVWCVGEIEEIVSVTFENGEEPPNATYNNYTGNSSQGVDSMLSAVVPNYTDTLTNIGPDNYNLAYTVARIPESGLEGFPRLIAKIKGLKMHSPVPKTQSTRLTSGSEGIDTLSYVGNEITITDGNGNGHIGQFIRYEESELINNETYNFEIIVTAISNIGSGDVSVKWCGPFLDDDATGTQMNINSLGTYTGSASFNNYTSTNNYIRFDVSGADAGVSLTYTVTLYNALGNSVKAYSDVAAVALNHLVTDDQIGLGQTSDLKSYVDLINRNSQVLASGSFSESRSAIGLTLTRKAKIQNHLEVMRGYARCTLANRGGIYYYFPLMARATTFDINMSKISRGTFKPVPRPATNTPNIIRVYYTDTFTDPWKDNYVQVSTTEVENGTERKREAVYRLPGFQTRTAALRYAYDRINERLRGFNVTFRTREAVYGFEDGETFNLQHDYLGKDPIKMKMLYKKKVGPSEWEVKAEQEDDSIYSDEIADFDPEAGTITLPDPNAIIDATALVLTAEAPKYQSSVYITRLRVTWTLSEYQYNHFYRVQLFENDSDLLLGTQDLNKGVSIAVFTSIQENIQYRVEVKVVGVGGNQSSGLTGTITPLGKDFPPSDVPDFTVSENNGIVTLEWGFATDNDEIWYYIVQYGVSGFAWDSNESRTLNSRIDSRSITTRSVPPGTYDFLIKAVDNAGNQSTNAARVIGIVVNQNQDEHIVDSGLLTIDFASSTNVVRSPSNRVTEVTDWTGSEIKAEYDYITKNGQSFTSMFTNSMDTYTDAILSYGPGVVATLYTNSIDFGQNTIAQWSVNTRSEEITKTGYKIGEGEMLEALVLDEKPEVFIQLSTDNSTWYDHAGLNVTGEGRYMRLKVQSKSANGPFIYRAGNTKYEVKKPILTQYFDVTTTPQEGIIMLDHPASEILDVQYSVSASHHYPITVNYIGEVFGQPWIAPYVQVQLEVFDDLFPQTFNSMQVSGYVRYVKDE